MWSGGALLAVAFVVMLAAGADRWVGAVLLVRAGAGAVQRDPLASVD